MHVEGETGIVLLRDVVIWDFQFNPLSRVLFKYLTFLEV